MSKETNKPHPSEKIPASFSQFTPGNDKDRTEKITAPYINGYVQTGAGSIPRVSAKLSAADRLGHIKARFGVGRMNFRVEPALYAVGRPDDTSPVFVSANYKMSFDCLRSNLKGIDGWIMVIDTKGINVWCAAGKGTFGTEEIIRKIHQFRLTQVVTHRKLIVPQLGAPGIAAHVVKKTSGFKVIYGPVRAGDINFFLANNLKAKPEMRRVGFNLRERMVLIPNDFVLSLKYLLPTMLILFFLSGFGTDIYSVQRMVTHGSFNAVLLFLIYSAATVLPPILLPYLPGRAFSLKGFWLGVLLVLALIYYFRSGRLDISSLMITGWIIIILAIVSFITMNFTGNSTYTSLSGVRREMRYAVPLQIGGAGVGLIIWIVGLFV